MTPLVLNRLERPQVEALITAAGGRQNPPGGRGAVHRR